MNKTKNEKSGAATAVVEQKRYDEEAEALWRIVAFFNRQLRLTSRLLAAPRLAARGCKARLLHPQFLLPGG
jgi:hypothetical protein